MRTRFYGRMPLMVLTGLALVTGASVGASGSPPAGHDTGGLTPIQHLVVIYQENVSFDHYFATYPFATNPAGEPQFTAAKETPTINGLCSSTGPYLLQTTASPAQPCQQQDPLLNGNNPNTVQPFRLDRSQAQTADQDHNNTAEQNATHAGQAD